MYWIDDDSSGRGKQRTYVMDTDSDKNNLPTSTSPGVKQGDDDASCAPCGIGSKALSIASGKVFILNSSDVWSGIGG